MALAPMDCACCFMRSTASSRDSCKSSARQRRRLKHPAELDLFVKDPKSDHFQKRLQTLHAFGNVRFGVCRNTMNARKIGPDKLLADAFVQDSIVPSGVVRLMELQEQGYTYVRP